MKKLIIMAAIMLQSVVAMSQMRVPIHTPKWAIVGGAEGKNYAVIIASDMSKASLVDKTTKFLSKYGIVNAKDVKLNEIDESTGEYAVPFLLRQTVAGARLMGMPIAVAPIKVHAQLRFEFHDNGKVMVVVENMSNDILMVKTQQYADGKKALREDYAGECGAVLGANMFLTKLLLFANGINIQDAMAQLDDYFSDIDSKYKVYNQMVRDGDASWMTNEEYVAWEKENSHHSKGSKNYNLEIERLNQYVEEHRMFLLSEDRWEKYVRNCFDNLFISIATSLEGTIEGVAEDGEQTWVLVENALVPVDPKLQKKYLKKGLSYYNKDN